ncbi:MAG: response regulator [Cyanobacteria bacterium J06626_14]
MAIHPDIRDQAYQFFIQEAPDLLQTIESGLLNLSQERKTADVHQLMRAAHSLKGGSSSVGLDAIATLAHRLENIFKVFYDESISIDSTVEHQLLHAYDCLRLPLWKQIETGFFDAEEAISTAEPVFARLETRYREALSDIENYIPTSEDLGMDMMLSIFEVDVAKGLEHLSHVAAQPHNYEVVGELRAQNDVFAGFAEILGLKSMSAIATATQQALEKNPDRALEITQLALQDFEEIRQAVLLGDRAPSIEPSNTLLALANSMPASSSHAANTDSIESAIADDMSIYLDDLDSNDESYFFEEHDTEFEDLDFQFDPTELESIEFVNNEAHSSDPEINDAAQAIAPHDSDALVDETSNLSGAINNLNDFLSNANDPNEDLDVINEDVFHEDILHEDASINVDEEINAVIDADPLALGFIAEPASTHDLSDVNGVNETEDPALWVESEDLVFDSEVEDYRLLINPHHNQTENLHAEEHDIHEEPAADDKLVENDDSLVDAYLTDAYRTDESHTLDNILSEEEFSEGISTEETVEEDAFEDDLSLLGENLTISELIDDEPQSMQQSGCQTDVDDSPLETTADENPTDLLQVESFDQLRHLVNANGLTDAVEFIKAAEAFMGAAEDFLEAEGIALETDLPAIENVRSEESFPEPDIALPDTASEESLYPAEDNRQSADFASIQEFLENDHTGLENDPSANDYLVDILDTEKTLEAVTLSSDLLDADPLDGNAADGPMTGPQDAITLEANTADTSNTHASGTHSSHTDSSNIEHSLLSDTAPESAELTQSEETLNGYHQIELDMLTDATAAIKSTAHLPHNSNDQIAVDSYGLDSGFSESEHPSFVENGVEPPEPVSPDESITVEPITSSANSTNVVEVSSIEEIEASEPDASLVKPLINTPLEEKSVDEAIPTLDGIIEHPTSADESSSLIEPNHHQTAITVNIRAKSEQPGSEKGGSIVAIGRAGIEQSAQPVVVKQSAPTSTQNTSQRPTKPGSSRQKAVKRGLTMRVDSGRLERMNNLVGELAINREGLALQNDQLQSVLQELLKRFSRFQTVVNSLREVSDKMLVAPERHGYPSNGTLKAKNGAAQPIGSIAPLPLPNPMIPAIADTTSPEFDPLEMDRYGGLHLQIQGILEDLVQLEETVEDINLFARQSDQTLEKQRYMLIHLRDELVWARMLPMGEILNRFPRVLRDMSRVYQKPVNLRVVGTGVLVDKVILEKLYDPLLHLLRNAFDHGIEPPALRKQRGKPEQGQIEIRAFHRGNQTIIEIFDDGQGISYERIRNRIVKLGWSSAAQVAEMSTSDLLEFIFVSGFSTARQVSQISGRGVGLDAVRSQIQSIKGKITINSTPGKGTTFTLYLPLTLTIAKLITCLVGPVSLALPSDSIEEIVTPQPNQINHSANQRFLNWKNKIIPIHRLIDLLEYNCPLAETSVSKALASVPTPQNWSSPMLIFRQDQDFFALEVDRLINEQELVIKPFGQAIASPKYAYGSAILGDGSLVPVIDASALLQFRKEPVSTARVQESLEEQPLKPGRIIRREIQAPTILVVDDAVTIRRTLSLSLSRAGFRVLQARDGREALEQLQQASSVKLIICDIEMPNMNGFEFLTHRRQDAALSAIPTVMLTSRGNDKHRWLANQLGATAYFTKPYLEQEFLSTIKEMIVDRKDAATSPPQENMDSGRLQPSRT